MNIEKEIMEDVLRYLVLEYYQQAEYIKFEDANNPAFKKEFEFGKLFAYAEVLNTLMMYAESNEIDPSKVGFDEIKPYAVLKFRPKNWNENG